MYVVQNLALKRTFSRTLIRNICHEKRKAASYFHQKQLRNLKMNRYTDVVRKEPVCE